MARERELKVRILGDASSATAALGRLDGATKTTGSKFAGLAGAAKVSIAGAAGAAVATFAKGTIDAFKQAETAQANLRAAFAKSPKLVNANIKEFQKLNEELALKTKFDDDATASGQAVLAGFDLTTDQIKTLTPLLQDYATRTGKDLPSAATDLGKAILGQGRALKAIGVDFKNTGSHAGNAAALIDILGRKVGGLAEKEGKTAAGRFAILNNQFGEMQEKLGEKLLPALVKLGDFTLKYVIPFFEHFIEGSGMIIRQLQNVVRFIADKLLGAFEWIVRGAANAFGWVPGLGDKLRAAARDIEKFRDDVNAALDGIKDKTVALKFDSRVESAKMPGQAGYIPPLRPGEQGPLAPGQGRQAGPVINSYNTTVNAQTNATGPEIAREINWRGRGWR